MISSSTSFADPSKRYRGSNVLEVWRQQDDPRKLVPCRRC